MQMISVEMSWLGWLYLSLMGGALLFVLIRKIRAHSQRH